MIENHKISVGESNENDIENDLACENNFEYHGENEEIKVVRGQNKGYMNMAASMSTFKPSNSAFH